MLIRALLVEHIDHLCDVVVGIFQHVFADRRLLLDHQIAAPAIERIVVRKEEGKLRMLPSYKLPEVGRLANDLAELFSGVGNQISPHLISLEPAVDGELKDILIGL